MHKATFMHMSASVCMLLSLELRLRCWLFTCSCVRESFIFEYKAITSATGTGGDIICMYVWVYEWVKEWRNEGRNLSRWYRGSASCSERPDSACRERAAVDRHDSGDTTLNVVLICMYVCMHVCMHVCMYAYISMYDLPRCDVLCMNI